jgi:hypothetical protein
LLPRQAADHSTGIVPLLVGLLVLAFGVGILRVRPYRPDLGEAWWQFDPVGSMAQRASGTTRSWWTGGSNYRVALTSGLAGTC